MASWTTSVDRLNQMTGWESVSSCSSVQCAGATVSVAAGVNLMRWERTSHETAADGKKKPHGRGAGGSSYAWATTAS